MDFVKEPRGFRNNNPGNIRWGDAWKGLSDTRTDKSFCQFFSVEYGIRAIFKILDTYRNKHRLTTIARIVDRWAPPAENDTGSYIDAVSRSCEIGAHEILDGQTPSKLVHAIMHHENGTNPFSLAFIESCRDL